jgi:PAS domain-containing protein
MWDQPAEHLHGKHASSGFEHHSRGAVNELLRNARRTGESGEIRARLQGTRASTSVVATPFRAGDAMRLLVRLRTLDAANSSAALNKSLSRLVDAASDGVVVTDSSGRILVANPAFLALVEVHDEARVKGQPLMNWLSLADGPLAALVAKVRRDGIARQVDSRVKRTPASISIPVEISAALLTEGDQECIGFTLHPSTQAATRPGLDDAAAAALLRVLGAGIEALGSRLPEQELASVVRDAAAMLGLSAEDLSQRVRSHAGAAATSSAT